MGKESYQILAWESDSHKQETPVIFVGKRVRSAKLEEGMEIFGIGSGAKYRLEKMEFENERDEKNSVHTLTLIPLLSKGEGKPKIGKSVNSFLAVKMANIEEAHQELFYPEQSAFGNIKDGIFLPNEEYLVDWYGMFMKYFDILRAHPFRDQSEIDREMPKLIRRCIEEFGVGVFNALIREHYVGKKCEEVTFQEAWSSMFKYDWFYNIDPNLGFPSRVLEHTMRMTTHFDDAVKTVVFKEGVKLDIAKLL